MSDMLSVPLKKTESISLSSPLQVYIQNNYNQDPQTYSLDFKQLDQYRNEIIHLEPHSNSLNKLFRYYGQLNILSIKFAINEHNRSVASYNINYERACVVFNLGALYSQMASTMDFCSDEGLKLACSFYQSAAGMFAFIRDTILAAMLSVATTDLQSQTLNALEQLMLGQAQECFFRKAILGKMKDGITAKLAARASDYYDKAYEYAKDNSVFTSDWTQGILVKKLTLMGSSHYRMAKECGTTAQYGIQVARLNAALEYTRKAKDIGTSCSAGIANAASNLKAELKDILPKIAKDNDVIYLQPVPDSNSLPAIPRVDMVKSAAFPDLNALEFQSIIGSPLFQSLVPYEIHQAVASYEERKNIHLKELIKQIETAFVNSDQLLSSLNLPASIQVLEQPMGLPPLILQKSEEVRSLGGIQALRDAIKTVEALSEQDQHILQEAIAALSEEANEDKEMRERFKERWDRPSSDLVSINLRSQANKHSETLNAAKKSDVLVKQKLDANLFGFESISMRREELEQSIPSSNISTTLAASDPNVKKLKDMLSEYDQIRIQKNALLEELKAKEKQDDICRELMNIYTSLAAKSESFSSINLDQVYGSHIKEFYGPMQEKMEYFQSNLPRLMQDVNSTNSIFASSKQMDSVLVQRQTAVNALDAAHRAYKELSENLREGVNFYVEYQVVLEKFRNSCSDYCFARKMETKEFLQELSAKATGVYTAWNESIPLSYGQAPPSNPSVSGACDKPPLPPRPNK